MGVSLEEIGLLYSSANHSPYLLRHRTVVINERIRIIGLLFSIMLLLWIPVDFLLLPAAVAKPLLTLRVLGSITFLLLALSVTRQSSSFHAFGRLMVMVMTPSLFYSIVQYFSHNVAVGPWGEILSGIYDLLPFLVIAGLALFPLTIIEMLSVSSVALVVMAVGATYSQDLPTSFYFSAAWMLLLILIIDIISATIQLNYMSSLLHRVSVDSLTGAMTRHSGEEIIDLHFQLSIEEERPFAIAFVDLDHFKSINDEYGHDAGDVALTGCVRELKRMLRRGDIVVRWGGEEFLLVLQDSDMEGVNLILNRIQAEWLGMRPDGKPLTASIGVAERITDGANDWLSLVEVADKRMYQAKTQGRAQAVTQ